MHTPSKTDSVPLSSILMACAGGALIGLSPIFIRASDLGPMTTGFYRLLFALPALWAWMHYEEKTNQTKLTQTDYLILGLGGLFFAFDLALWNWSIDYTVIVNATLFNNTSAFFVPLIMWLIFSDKPTPRTLFVAFFGFMGCALLVGESFRISLGNLVGDIVSLASGLMVTAYVITIKKIRHRLNTGVIMFWTSLVSFMGMGVFSLLFQESFWPLTSHDWISILGQSFMVHVLGQGLLAFSFGKIPANYGALIMLLAPVTAALFGWLIYGETLSALKLLGVLIIMVSIVVIKRR